MKKILIFLSCNLFLCLYSQTKVFYGRVIGEDLFPIRGAIIFADDSVVVGETDKDGFFRIEVPDHQEKVSIRYFAYESALIVLSDKDCRIEVVMLARFSYHFRFILFNKARMNCHRKKWFDSIPEIHKQALDKGIFETDYDCHLRVFEPY